MTLRTLAREIRDYPATACFSLIWVLVFVALVAVRMHQQPAPSLWQFLVLGIGEGHRFGDLTLRELGQGEIWRLVTCTFIHYSLLHIALNLLAFYLLGTLVESWYGTPLFIFIYGVTGGLGNLVSAMIRHALGSGQSVHSGGGSVVIMGLIGLCAVMGWRSRTAGGSDLGWQMFKALGLTGLLGIAFPRYIDNWGHAGGAIVGAILGLFHRWFLRQYSRPASWGMGVLTALVLAACAIAQVNADRREAPLRRDTALRVDLFVREVAYRSLLAAPAIIDQQTDHQLLAGRLDALAGLLDRGTTRADYRRVRDLARSAAKGTLSDAEKVEFKQRAGTLAAQLHDELKVRLRDFWEERRLFAARRR